MVNLKPGCLPFARRLNNRAEINAVIRKGDSLYPDSV
jgi:hypothetical protein